ncbi:hypothetical protein FIBSPDRAFT_852569 [Athelia psychrophila]|uniref:Uncharacterized protein n=1 Tax=Athelia psychrophila TaxID=1759441 RepID=A0A166RM89_9AGAM|nr:hypothetical protein FIBSPDRAFT_852569 [Fibularhizoctonia sp. CBS 109695]
MTGERLFVKLVGDLGRATRMFNMRYCLFGFLERLSNSLKHCLSLQPQRQPQILPATPQRVADCLTRQPCCETV